MMGNDSKKIYVAPEFRKNSLANLDSSITATVYYTDNSSPRAYTNIHYPNAFSKKVFSQKSNIDHVEFHDSKDGSKWSKYPL